MQDPRIERARPILDLIYRHESIPAVKAQGAETHYDVVWGGIKPKDRPKKLSAMTVGRVLWWQDLIDAQYMSEAAGAGQFMEDTLRDLVRQGIVSESEMFSAETQDRLALALLDRRGWARCESGQITIEQFGNELAKEWASLPVITGPKKGRSYYAGDGLNKAHASVEEVLSAIRSALMSDAISAAETVQEDAVIAWLKSAPVGMRQTAEGMMQVAQWLIANPIEGGPQK